MLSLSRRVSLVLAATAAAAHGVTVYGQESLRNSLDFERLNQQRQTNIKNEYYNLRFGPVLMTLGAGMSTMYSDNINNSQNAAQEDFVIRPSANVSLLWKVTDNNQLAVDVGFSYAKYINHPENDRPQITPGGLSDISYDIFIGGVRINLHDRFSYSQDPLGYGSGAVAGEADMGHFRNSAGLTGVIQVRDGSISLGYDHVNNVFFNNTFSNSDSAAEMLFARGSYKWNPTLTVGMELSGAMTAYSVNVRPDNRNWTAGPYAEWRLTSAISMELRGGVSSYQISSQGTLGDTAAPLSYYASFDVTHQLNKEISHALTFSRDTSQGIGLSANFLETMAVTHSASWRIISNVSLQSSLFFEHTQDSSEGTGVFLPESYARFGGGLSVGYQLLRQLSANLAYMHTEKESSISGLNYSVNTVTLGLNYRF